MSNKIAFAILFGLTVFYSGLLHACRIPHSGPQFDELIQVETVDATTSIYEVWVPADMNGVPFFSIYLHSLPAGPGEREDLPPQPIELESEDGGLSGKFALAGGVQEMTFYLRVHYQGPNDPCGTVASKTIGAIK